MEPKVTDMKDAAIWLGVGVAAGFLYVLVSAYVVRPLTQTVGLA